MAQPNLLSLNKQNCSRWVAAGSLGRIWGMTGVRECLSLLNDFWSSFLAHRILTSLSKNQGKAKGLQPEHVSEGWGEDGGLALPAPIGRSRRRFSTQATREYNSSQKAVYFTVGKSEHRDWGSTQIIHRGRLLGLNTKNLLLLRRMLCQPRSLLARLAEELSCLVSVLRSRGQALPRQARSAAGAQH